MDSKENRKPGSKKKGQPSSWDVLIGKQLQKRRLMLDLSQNKLAEAVNLTFQQIQKYEKGTNRISAVRLLEFFLVLGCSVDYFYEPIRKAMDESNLEFPDLAKDISASSVKEHTDAAIYKAGKAICDIPDREVRNNLLAIAHRATTILGAEECRKAC